MYCAMVAEKEEMRIIIFKKTKLLSLVWNISIAYLISEAMRISEKQDQMNYLKTSPYALLTVLKEMNADKKNTTLTKCVCTYIDT